MTNQTTILGGGCFWCLEAVFKEIFGVKSVVSGYSGGFTSNPDYNSVCSGNTGHAEVIKINFDNKKISFEEILEIFFSAHDPTTINRQGNDVGTQYRSIIFLTSRDQEVIVKNFIDKVSMRFKNQIVTEVNFFEKFFIAEDYHQNYFYNNSTQPYCSFNIVPKIKKIKKLFPKKIK
tara:strand:+ start:1320 stop:1847 length:528 start_codon:yes stop_codon:yes gene_type:complete